MDALLEREAELQQLRSRIDAAVHGQGAAVAVVGPAGIGKTSLLAAVRDHARSAGLAVLVARGGELERGFSYGVVRQLFERALRELSPRARKTVLGGAAALAAKALGLAGAAAKPSAATPFTTLHALYWVCANLAERRPLLLAIDDLHWCDEASLRWLAYLQRRVAELPLLVVTAARPPADAAQAELLAGAIADALVQPLAPLSEAAVAAVVGSTLGSTPQPEFVQACHAATRGNPFLCTTLLSALAEEGVRPEAREAARVIALGASAVSAVVVHRLGRIEPAAAALARAVAVLGNDVELHHAATLAQLSAAQAAAAADALVTQEVLRTQPSLDFSHPLVRAAVHERIPAAERALLHRRAAQLLAGEGLAPERIAAHLLVAEPAGDAATVESLRAAARRAAAHGDARSALSFLRRALREPPAAGLRAALLHELGVAELAAGEMAPAALHMDEARSLERDPSARAQIASDLSQALLTPGRYADAVAVLECALDELAGHDRDLALRLEAELYQCAQMQPSLYANVKDRLDRYAADAGSATRGERGLLAMRATETCLRTGSAAQVRAWCERAFERGLQGDQDAYASLWGNAAFPLIFADGFAAATRVTQRAVDDAHQRGAPLASVRAFAARSMLHFRQGALLRAASDARTAVELGLTAGYRVALIPLGVLIESLVESGELAAAQTALHDAGGDGDGVIAERFFDNWLLHARALLREAQGRSTDAMADFEQLGARGEHGWRAWNPAMFAWRSNLALLHLRAGQRAQALARAEEEVALAQRWGAPRALGIALRVHALASEPGARIIERLRQSVALLAPSGAQLEHARSLQELGAAMRRAGQPSAAREPLHAAMELAHRCGAVPLAARAREELLASGARPRRMVRSGIEALSASELRVSRLAAAGMSNRAIAQTLFVTLRTVEVHLTHAYQKLDIASREQLQGVLTPPSDQSPARRDV